MGEKRRIKSESRSNRGMYLSVLWKMNPSQWEKKQGMKKQKAGETQV